MGGVRPAGRLGDWWWSVVGTAVTLVVLVAVLLFAIARPWRLPEAVAAVPGAVVVVAAGLVAWPDAWHEMVDLGPTVAFLAAVLVLSFLADREGVFGYAGTLAARWSRGSPRRLLGAVFVLASIVTAVLSLDATVVLLTPVVLATASAVAVRPQPHVYACTHLANTASLLLPVSNLTNLLAFAASGLSFAAFAGLMAAPWLVVIVVEYVVFRRFFAADLAIAANRQPPPPVPAPRFALAVLGATLAGFVIAEPFGVHPAWVAAAGAVVLAVGRLSGAERPTRTELAGAVTREAGRLLTAANPAFLAFVLSLGVVVLAVRQHSLGTFVARLVPGQAGLVGLLGAATLAAVLANVLNNLPATLMLVPLVGQSPGLVLAVLLGVNIGPNLTYVGSLATLLWRQVLHAHQHEPGAARFVRLGALTVPLCLVPGVIALWLALGFAGIA